MLVELPLASFFLSKLLGQKSANVDIDHLQSLDPELYKNLLYLKNYDGDVQDLGLDFTIVSEEIGQAHVEEMKLGGANIPVTNENRIEYIHLVADFKLNRQIRSQCVAFRYAKKKKFSSYCGKKCVLFMFEISFYRVVTCAHL